MDPITSTERPKTGWEDREEKKSPVSRRSANCRWRPSVSLSPTSSSAPPPPPPHPPTKLFQFFRVEEGRMGWWIKAEVLLTVRWLTPVAALLQTSCATMSKSSPPSALPPSLQNGGKITFTCFSGKDTLLGASPSQSLETVLQREERKISGIQTASWQT